MPTKDPYDILGVSRTASQDEIKRAYRRLAKEHHPDRHHGDKAAEGRFKEVQAAYEVLGDADRRKQFDRFGAGGPAPEFHNWGHAGASPFGEVQFDFGGGDLTSIFEQFFSRGRTQARSRRATPRQRPRGADIEHAIDITFEEAVRGTRRGIELSDGRGKRPEQIEFRVPAGVSDGQLIRLRGKGNPGTGGPGDMMIRFHVRPHPHFRRDGLDLLLDLPLSVTEAALGAKVNIPTLDGTTRLTVPPGTASGTRLRLRGKGIRDERSGNTGDMFAIVAIRPPKTVSDRARDLLEQLATELGDDPRRALGWE